MCERYEGTIGRNAPKLMLEFDKFLAVIIEEVEAVRESTSGGRATARLGGASAIGGKWAMGGIRGTELWCYRGK
jgi:hypothetical protein